MNFENHKETEMPSGREQGMRKGLTDPVVGDLITAREK